MKRLHGFKTYLCLSTALLALSGYANQAIAEHTPPNTPQSNSATPPDCQGTQRECAKTMSATFDEQGLLWIAFVSDNTLYVQSSPDQGQTFSPALKVNQTPEPIIAQGENRPKIKAFQQGQLYLTWAVKIDHPTQRHSGNIRFSASQDGGKSFSQPVTVNDDNQVIGHSFDSLAIGKNGEIFITWLDARDTVAAKKAGQEFEGSSLYYSVSTDGGKTFSPNRSIAAHTCQCCRLQTQIDTDNTPVIIWRHIFTGGIRDHALLKFSAWDKPGEVQRMSYENWKIDACPHHGTGFSIADDGTYHATWFSNAETQQGLFYGYSTDHGQSFSKPVNFAKQGAGHPDVLAIGKQVFLVWQHFDGKQTHIQLMKSTDAGLTWSQPANIGTTEKKADNPFLVSDGKTAYLSWKVIGQDFRLQAIQ